MSDSHSYDAATLRQERRAHETFAETRRRVYVERAEVLRRLDDHALHGGSPLVVTGDSGAGKSALFAYWSHTFRQRFHNRFLLPHYGGIGTMGSSPVGLLRRIMLEIGEYFERRVRVPDDPDEIVEMFPEWLASIPGQGRIVLALDALDQLEPGTAAAGFGPAADSGSIDWLPGFIPSTVSLMVSTCEGPTLDMLSARGWEILPIPPLSADERRAAFHRYLGESARELSAEIERRIVSDVLFANPLFLRTSIQEIRATSSSAGSSIEHYRTAASIEEIFDRVLDRFEHEHGSRQIHAFTTLVWGMRHGLGIEESEQLTGLSRTEIDGITESLHHYLVRHEEGISFFHEQMRSAVERRYLAGDGSVRDLRLRIASYFHSQPPGQRRAVEEPWQLMQAGARDVLLETITDPLLFPILSAQRHELDLLGYWKVMGEKISIADAYFERFEREAEAIAGIVSIDDLYMQLGHFLQLCGEIDPAVEAYERAIRIRQMRLGADHPDTAEARISLADLLADMGKYELAESLCRSSILVQKQILGLDDPRTIGSLHGLGTILFCRGEYDESEQILRDVLSRRERLLEPNDPAISTTCKDLAMAVRMKGDYAETERLLQRAILTCSSSAGPAHPSTATMITELATLLGELGRTSEAVTMHRNALDIRERVLGPDHLETAQSYNNLASVLGVIGEHDEAERLLREAIRIHMNRLGKDHPSTAISLHNLGRHLFDRGDCQESEALLRQALSILEHVLGETHATTNVCRSNLGEVQIENGSLDEAEATLKLARQIGEGMAGQSLRTSALSLMRLADLRGRRGEHEPSRRMAAEALSILQECSDRPPGSLATALYILAREHFAEGYHERARSYCSEAGEILRSQAVASHRLATRIVELEEQLGSHGH